MKRISNQLIPILTFWLLAFYSCSNNDETPLTSVSYTTLVYMAADNSMDSEVEYTIAELKKGAAHSAGTVIVYVDRMDASPRLFKITRSGEEMLLKNYEEENSADPQTLARVIREVKELEPAHKFGLVVWSHSMGWLPYYASASTARLLSRNIISVFPRTRYIGIDAHPGNNTSVPVMGIDQLADALPDHVAEYIWFDVCLMGSVEALYELRNKSNYLIASPTEVLAEADYDASGIPYSKVLPYLFGGKEELMQACQTYIKHYQDMKQEILRSATIALVDASQLDGLFDVVHAILNGHLAEVGTMDISGLQVYHTQNVSQVFFDLKDMINRFKGDTDTALETQLNKTILYKAATASFVEVEIASDSYSGLSMYIPLNKWRDNHEYNYYFQSLEWAGVYK